MTSALQNAERRPAANGTASSESFGGDLTTTVDDTTPRCEICGHRIFAVESIRAGIGRDCRRALAVVA